MTTPAGESDAAMRLDKWLWHARVFKTRSLASAFCEETGLRIGGQSVRKAHYQVRVGDVLTFAPRHGPATVRVLRVLALSPRRLSPTLARALYDDLSPPPPPASERVDSPAVAARAAGSGRPTKQERRATDRLKGEF